jgi:hypothetical protein
MKACNWAKCQLSLKKQVLKAFTKAKERELPAATTVQYQ